MKSQFITEQPDFRLKENSDKVYVLDSPLIYESESLNCRIEVPAGFETDLASVPRMPVVYWFYGGRCHREAILHDYLYRIDSVPVVSFSEANNVFFEAMGCRGKGVFVRYGMWLGVSAGGCFSYHKRKVADKL